MPISYHATSVGVYKRMLTNLGAFLDKGAAFAEQKKIDPSVLVNSRLAADMLPLRAQVQIATDMAKGTCARLAGQEPPKFEDNETTLPELKARVAKTIAFLDSLPAAALESGADRHITIKAGPRTLEFENGEKYVLGFGTPNVFFHVTMAYAILRHLGVELGKGDFIGAG